MASIGSGFAPVYTGAKIVVRTVYGNSKGFEVKVGMHQSSALSSLLFVIVTESSREFRVALPWELLYADDLAVIAETEEELIKRLNEWKGNVESKGMRVSGLRGSASPVLTATGLVNGTWQFSTPPPTESTPLNGSPKNLIQVTMSVAPTTVPNLVQIRPCGLLGKWVKYKEIFTIYY